MTASVYGSNSLSLLWVNNAVHASPRYVSDTAVAMATGRYILQVQCVHSQSHNISDVDARNITRALILHILSRKSSSSFILRLDAVSSPHLAVYSQQHDYDWKAALKSAAKWNKLCETSLYLRWPLDALHTRGAN